MQEYVQKSISTTRPRSCASVSGFELSQPAEPGELGRRAEVVELGLRRVAARRLRRLRPGQLPSSRLRPVGALESLLDRLGVAGDPRLQLLVEPEAQSRARPRRDEHSRRRGGPSRRAGASALARPRCPANAIASIGTAAPSAYESVSTTPSKPTSRFAAITVTAAEHRAGARHEDEPEAGAEQEPAAEVAPAAARQRAAAGGRAARRTTARAASARRRRAARLRGSAAGPPAGRRGRAASAAKSVKTVKLATMPGDDREAAAGRSRRPRARSAAPGGRTARAP